MEIIQSGHQTENQMKKHESNIRELWDNIKQDNLCIIGIPEGEEKEKGNENIFAIPFSFSSPSGILIMCRFAHFILSHRSLISL